METVPLPEWLIDKHSAVGRTFVAHTREPRFFAEVVATAALCDDDLRAFRLDLAGGLSLCRVVWIEVPLFKPKELIPSLRQALDGAARVTTDAKPLQRSTAVSWVTSFEAWRSAE
jgi:hypothetical protein